ncbi:hypothetical protein [Halomonas sp. CSM-2]|uniref:hypothetical protein n=1 Tax=Halomonas sp. CSM-2 TaxID=1975722 RepID=UPI000A280A53|nr:hypothetical protein [Halomonas sp. CSM-2]
MAEMVLSIINWLAELQWKGTTITSLAALALTLSSYRTARESLTSSYKKNHIVDRKLFIVNCKPLVDNLELTNHDILLLEQSYQQLTKRELDIILLQRIIKHKKLKLTKNIGHFINAGHLVMVRKGKLVEKSDHIMIKYIRKIYYSGLFATLTILIYFNLRWLPNTLKASPASENETAMTFISISILTFYIIRKIIAYLDGAIDKRNSKQWLINNA